MSTAIATIGHNRPPPDPTPFDAVQAKILDLYGECCLWLDGAKVDNQDLADGIGNLKGAIREAVAESKKAHKIEKQPWLDGASEVQDRYNALWAQSTRALNALDAALQPWLVKLAAEQEAAAKAAREIAEAAQREAEQAIRTAPHDDLAAREAAEAKITQAKTAEKIATKTEKAKPQAGGLMGRRIGLKTSWKPTLTDAVAAARYYWGTTDRQEIEALLTKFAERDCRYNGNPIPGFEIEEIKAVV